MIINLMRGFVQNSYCDLTRCCPNTGSRGLGAATEFPIIAQCKPPVQILKGFFYTRRLVFKTVYQNPFNCRVASTLHGNGTRL
jgi:hypothetical protein